MKLNHIFPHAWPKARIFIASLIGGEVIALALLQHRLNFWGLPWDKQLLAALVGGLAVGLVVAISISPVRDRLLDIPSGRWVLFALPALAAATLIAWNSRPVPEVGHVLEIVPTLDSPTQQIRISEIRAAYGNLVPLKEFSDLQSWRLSDDLLVAQGRQAQTLRYAFDGPVGEQIRVSFLTSPSGGRARVVLDGRAITLDLEGPSENQTRARLYTRYFWGSLDSFFLPALAAVDALAILIFLAAIWAAHEITQSRSRDESHKLGGLAAHMRSLVVLTAVAAAFHAVSFITAPLAVVKDSPSYLQGAEHFVLFHDLQGVSSYRGLGTTFLFAPAMAIFGRNPVGVKLVLHLVALSCVLVTYRIGWQLSGDRRLAFLAGLATAMMPDLYAYSNLVLSEVPQALFVLVFCSGLISALRTRAPVWIMLTLLTGSAGALLRPENVAALSLGVGVLLADIVVSRVRASGTAGNRNGDRHWRRQLAYLAGAILLALVPLTAWSLHNWRLQGYFGLSDYGGEILYDGWVYWGENSGIRIADRNLKAVSILQSVYPIGPTQGNPAPTGWTMLSELASQGYTERHAFTLLGEAAAESIRANPGKAFQILLSKLRGAAEPLATLPDPFLSPGEKPRLQTFNARYFDKEVAPVQGVAPLRRWLYGIVARWYAPIYGPILGAGLLAIWLAFYRRPTLTWISTALIALNSLLLPVFVGMGLWRYLFPGLVLTQILAVVVFGSYAGFVSDYVGAARRLAASLVHQSGRGERLIP